MTNPARDFIEEITDATGKYKWLDGTPLVADAYKVLREMDTPSNPAAEVDDEAYDIAFKVFREGGTNLRDAFQAYEQVKLAKVYNKDQESIQLKPHEERLYRGGDKELVEDGILPKPSPLTTSNAFALKWDKPLPKLPEKFRDYTAFDDSRWIKDKFNQLIDYLAAKEERLG